MRKKTNGTLSRKRKPRVAKLRHELGKARRKKGVTRLDLARALGVSYTTLWRWEKGEIEPPPYAEKSWKAALRGLRRAS